jgi:hypothetical protein
MAAQGWKAYAGLKKETTFGTGVAPTEFGEFTKEGMFYKPNFKTSPGLNSGRARTKRIPGRIDAGGPLDFAICPDDLIGLILKDILGKETYTALGGGDTGAFTHAFVPAGAADFANPVTPGTPGLTLELGRDDTELATNIWWYSGGHVRKIKISGKADGFLEASVTFSFQNAVSGKTAQVPSYTARTPIMFHTGTMTLDSSAYNFTEFDLEIDSGQKDRIAGASRLKLQDKPGPLTIKGNFGGFVQTAAIDMTGATVQDVIGKFYAGTAAAISIQCQGPALITATTKYPAVQIDMSTIYFDGEVPMVSAPTETMMKVPFESVNGTLASLLTVTVTNGRTAAY